MIQLEHVSKRFANGAQAVEAVRDVSLHIEKGKIAGIIGFSGAGKSTLARCINLLERPTEGRVVVDGVDLTALRAGELREKRKKIGMIFQQFNLFSARTAYGNVDFPLRRSGIGRRERDQKVRRLLELVGLSDKAGAYPSQLSGGQKQRVAIARALANDPEVLISDESTSALDPQTTKSILQLLKDLNRTLGITIVVITHEMQVVKEICDVVYVMDGGQVVEEAEVRALFDHPMHPYTQGLLKSIPRLEDDDTKRLYMIKGMVPNPLEMPPGCHFSDRCDSCMDICRTQMPKLVDAGGRKVRCFLYEDADGHVKSDAAIAEAEAEAVADAEAAREVETAEALLAGEEIREAELEELGKNEEGIR